MAVKDLTSAQVTALYGAGTERLARSGVLVPTSGLQPWYEWMVNAINHLDQASAGWLQVRQDDAAATTVRVMPGRAVIAGVPLVYAGGAIALAAYNNDTAYLYLQNDGAGAAEIIAVADGTGWPATPHVRLASVVLASGAITSITDLRPEALFLAADDLVRYALAISSQGSTAGPSTVTITLRDRHGTTNAASTHYLRVRVCDSAGFANATNATIAAGANTTAVETHSAGKDLTFKSHTDGVITITLTDATAETVTLRIGAPSVGGRRGDYTTSLNVTHA